MVKAKDFWDILCNEFDYRFFSGVAHSEFKSLYNTMDSKIMHYVPAANESIALGLASGANIAGYKSCIIVDAKFIFDINRQLEFNRKFKIPVLIISSTDYNFNLPKRKIRTKKDIENLVLDVEKKSVPGLMILGKGVLK